MIRRTYVRITVAQIRAALPLEARFAAKDVMKLGPIYRVRKKRRSRRR
jgi:hypothetical protein